MDISGDVYATTYFRFSGYAVVTHPPLLRASTSAELQVLLIQILPYTPWKSRMLPPAFSPQLRSALHSGLMALPILPGSPFRTVISPNAVFAHHLILSWHLLLAGPRLLYEKYKKRETIEIEQNLFLKNPQVNQTKLFYSPSSGSQQKEKKVRQRERNS